MTVATAGHPVEPLLRSRQAQYNLEVNIGDNVWLEPVQSSFPESPIGENTVIGAGSIVTKDIPAMLWLTEILQKW